MENIDNITNRSLDSSYSKSNKIKNLCSSFSNNKNTIESNNSIENSRNNNMNIKTIDNKPNILNIRYKQNKSRNYKLNKPMSVKGRCYYDELRKLQIKILKK